MRRVVKQMGFARRWVEGMVYFSIPTMMLKMVWKETMSGRLEIIVRAFFQI